MVVQHNLTAMNSNRMLGITTGSQAKSTEKLSSGYKINRAADDAAGLSISEKMRKQIRGLTQASLNAEDGISAVQTAEGALNEVQDMLQRMNELAVKAANGTMSENDRKYVQDEINQLVTEIDRVSETTKFNETYLLKGDAQSVSSDTDTTATVAGQTVTLKGKQNVTLGDYSIGTVSVKSAVSGTTAGIKTTAEITVGNATDTLKELLDKSATGSIELVAASASDADSATTTPAKADVIWNVTDGDGNTLGVSIKTSDLATKLGLQDINLTGATQIAANDTITIEKELVQTQKQKADLAEQGLSTTGAATAVGLKDIKVGADLKVTLKEGASGVAEVTAYDKGAVPAAVNLSLHVGADSTSNNKISLDIRTMSAKGLGLRTETGDAIKVDGKDSTNADKAIDIISEALQRVSTQRSALGAVQNRLEHTIANLDNVVENTTAAESQIRDTDMATEMVKYSNNNILAQAGQAMLAQANQANQGVLSLLG